MGQWLPSASFVEQEKAVLKKKIEECREATGRVPGLTLLLVGDNPASLSYVKKKETMGKELGMDSKTLRLPADITESELLETVERLNNDEKVHGMIVQLPLPPHLAEEKVIAAIDPEKDVDGFHILNSGRLLKGQESLLPCTPLGIVQFLKANGFALKGKRADVGGRSNIDGKPLALLLLQEHMTVTVAHSRTEDLPGVCREADYLFVAVGKALLIKPDYVKAGAVVIDVGTNSLTDRELVERELALCPEHLARFRKNNRILVGDVHPTVIEKAAYLTPVPGGVGPLTVLFLIKNTLKAFLKREKLS